MEGNAFPAEKNNVAGIYMGDLVKSLRNLKNKFCEDKNSSEYWCYVFFKRKGQNRYIYNDFKKWGEQAYNFEIILKLQDINKDIEGLKLFIRQLTDENKSLLDDLRKASEIQTDTLLNFGFTCLDGKFCLDEQSGNYKLDKLIYTDSKGTEHCVIKSTAYEAKDKKIYMTVDGEKREVFFKKGSLLEKRGKLYFDALYILEQAKNKVIKDFNRFVIKMAIFIKSSYFNDDKWHFDDFMTEDLETDQSNNGYYISQHEEFYGGKKRTVNITTDGLKIFVGSVCFEKKDFSDLSGNDKMQTLRDNGFVEVDLYEISYYDQKTKEYIAKKAFLTPGFSESETIDKSIVAIEKDKNNVIGEIYKTPQQKKEVWNKLKENSTIINQKMWMVNYASFNINYPTLNMFLSNILGQNCDLKFELVINGKLCEKQSNAFSFDYKNGTEEIVVEYAGGGGIYSLCLKVFNGTNKDPIKPFLFLQKDGEDLCIFAGNKRTNIKVTENKSLTLKRWRENLLNNWEKNFLNNRYKTGLEPVSNNSFFISKLSNQIELPTPGEKKPMQINIGENQK